MPSISINSFLVGTFAFISLMASAASENAPQALPTPNNDGGSVNKTTHVTLKIIGYPNQSGHLLGTFYTSQENFDQGVMLKPFFQTIQGDETVVTIEGLPEQPLMVSVFHDANDNTILDKNMMGIPSESYGFSQNARGKYGPPSFKQATFIPSKNDVIEISLSK